MNHLYLQSQLLIAWQKWIRNESEITRKSYDETLKITHVLILDLEISNPSFFMLPGSQWSLTHPLITFVLTLASSVYSSIWFPFRRNVKFIFSWLFTAQSTGSRRNSPFSISYHSVEFVKSLFRHRFARIKISRGERECYAN